MALAVASTTTAVGASTGTLVINKPSGVAVGDLLLIIPFNNAANGNYPLITGFTRCAEISNVAVAMAIYYRIADASDVSASNYTITSGFGGTSFGLATMMRVTGWATGNPVIAFFTSQGGQDATSFTPQVTGISQPRGGQTLLITAVGFNSGTGGFSTATISGYTVTSSGSNPTWTELIDTNTNTNGNTDSISLGVAYALDTDTSNITSFSCTGATDTNGGADNWGAIFAVIQEPTDVNGDVSHNAISPDISGITVTQVNVAPDVSHNAIPPIINGIDTRATAPTLWQKPPISSTNWLNEQI